MKLTRKVLYVISLGLALGLIGAYYLWDTSAKNQDELFSPVEISTHNLASDENSSNDEIKQVKEEIARLKGEVVFLHQLASASQTNPKSTILAKAEKSLHEENHKEAILDSAQQEKLKNNHQKKMETLENSFYNEAKDPEWSSKTVSAVQDALKQSNGLNEATRDIECHSSMCRVEIIDDGSGNVNQLIPSLAEKLANSLPNMIANRIDEGQGTGTLVLYMSNNNLSDQQK